LFGVCVWGGSFIYDFPNCSGSSTENKFFFSISSGGILHNRQHSRAAQSRMVNPDIHATLNTRHKTKIKHRKSKRWEKQTPPTIGELYCESRTEYL